jgi:hypothetical protein
MASAKVEPPAPIDTGRTGPAVSGWRTCRDCHGSHDARAYTVRKRLSRKLVLLLVCAALALGISGWVLCSLMGNTIPASPRDICSDHIRDIGMALQLYAKENGRFPRGGWDTEHGRPRWVQGLYRWFGKTAGDPGLLLPLLKCPSDTSPSVTSYSLNPSVAGRSLRELEGRKMPVVLVWETDHPGTHHYSYVFDGQGGWVSETGR